MVGTWWNLSQDDLCVLRSPCIPSDSFAAHRLILFSVAMWLKCEDEEHAITHIFSVVSLLRSCSFDDFFPFSVKGDRRLKERRLCLVSKR